MESLFENYKGSVVYGISNNKSGNTYVGSTRNYFTRKYAHLNMLRTNTHYNSRLKKDFKLFGEQSFAFEIIEFIEDRFSLYERESFWVAKLKPTYNIASVIYFNSPELKSPLKKDVGFLCLHVDTDDLVISMIEKRTNLPRKLVEDMLWYNIFTIGQFSSLTNLAISTITNKTRPVYSKGKILCPELDVAYPYTDLKGEGPKFIVRNEKSEKYIKV
ncbi:MAG: GIY-YIG nuclease family protein [Prolixibacteraceae bacterium]|nr:GIY-YIG nuclease family protein [Prolixibacteraceae bacterium]